jgi:hypothetical protein
MENMKVILVIRITTEKVEEYISARELDMKENGRMINEKEKES